MVYIILAVEGAVQTLLEASSFISTISGCAVISFNASEYY
jgi:hypothetical protein